MKGMGRIQRAALRLLASQSAGCTSTDLTYLADRKSALHALNSLTRRDLAVRAGTRMPASADGRGQPSRVFIITGAGRELAEQAS